MSTHAAVVSTSIGGPLKILQVPTIRPAGDEVLVKVQWTASTPLDLHQNDGGLMVEHPQVLGDSTAGTVVEVGPDVKKLKVGDEVFGFTWRFQKEKAHQEYCTAPEYLFGKLPPNHTLSSAVTLPNNFVTVFHTLTKDLSIPLPWPKPQSYTPPNNTSSTPILIWGGSSSVGQYALQILKYYGYTNLLTTSSTTHHSLLKTLGATSTFDYRSPDIISEILNSPYVKDSETGNLPLIFDCIGSKTGSLAPLAKLAKRGAKVAILLPVIVKDAAEGVRPEYSPDVGAEAEWEGGVDARGVRTHFYLDNEFFKEKLQSEIMPTLLTEGIVKPNKIRIIEGRTLLERAQGALDALRRKEVSGERLVWRVSE